MSHLARQTASRGKIEDPNTGMDEGLIEILTLFIEGQKQIQIETGAERKSDYTEKT